jgi:arginine deiminase
MHSSINIGVKSEIGELSAVILHSPGPEVENMTPETAQRALYSDILNLTVALREYSQFYGVLKKVTNTFQVSTLLTEVLQNAKSKVTVIDKIVESDAHPEIKDYLNSLTPEQLTRLVIEGVPMKRNTLTSFLSKESYVLPPLHNFFYTRDSAIAIENSIFVSRMANKVRERESIIMESIFDLHPIFKTQTLNPAGSEYYNRRATIEGGDLIVARHDILLAGLGARTNSHGIDFLIDKFKEKKETQHIIVQELPSKPESFIHLDMVFTLLSQNECMVYEPLILAPSSYSTVHIHIENGEVKKIRYVDNIVSALKHLGMDLEPLFCGGRKDSVYQDREQWHSGANFFAFAPGKVLGYERNLYTIEELHHHGYEVIKAVDVLDHKVHPKNQNKCVITIEGSELPRGGGGTRCMTMPLSRKEI